ncbi:MAG: LCP family protein [Anaerolineales bacterium]
MNRFEFLKKIKLPALGKLSVGQIIFWVVTLALAGASFVFARGLTACWQLTTLPGVLPESCSNATTNGTVFNPEGTPVASSDVPPTPAPVAPVELPPAWDGASRINILFIGLDARDVALQDGPPRSDSMMLFTIDPVSKTAGMLSIPRDMWVNIPGYGYSRINTAYASGEGDKLPGGGPGLAMKTVSQFIGVPVDYYVQVDFNTFTNFIDFLGGVDIYVDQTLTLDLRGGGYEQLGKLAINDQVVAVGKNPTGRFVQIEYPVGSTTKGWILAKYFQADGKDSLPVLKSTQDPSTVRLNGVITQVTDVRSIAGDPNQIKVKCCGERHFNGDGALAYARDRHTEGGDIDRAKRQQQVIFAIQKKVFDPAVFPGLVQQAPAIYQQFSSGIHTNMSFEDAIKLGILAKDISRESIKTGVIDTTMVTFENTILAGQNASIMKPISDKIRVLRDQIFTTSGPVSPIAQGDAVTLMRNEEARIRILDGTFTPGMDQRAGTFFQSQGMGVTEIGTATEVYSQTVVIVYGPKLYTLKYLQSTFGITANQIRFSPDPSSTVDIEIRLGSDLAGAIP